MQALTWRDALFSLKTCAAAMLAVWIALRLDLPQPIWAIRMRSFAPIERLYSDAERNFEIQNPKVHISNFEI